MSAAAHEDARDSAQDCSQCTGAARLHVSANTYSSALQRTTAGSCRDRRTLLLLLPLHLGERDCMPQLTYAVVQHTQPCATPIESVPLRFAYLQKRRTRAAAAAAAQRAACTSEGDRQPHQRLCVAESAACHVLCSSDQHRLRPSINYAPAACKCCEPAASATQPAPAQQLRTIGPTPNFRA
jgi:hypothetical protein